MQLIELEAIVYFQTLEFFKVKRYKYFYAQKFELAKQLYNFKPQIFLDVKQRKFFYTKKIWISEAIVLLQTPEAFSDEAIQKNNCFKTCDIITKL